MTTKQCQQCQSPLPGDAPSGICPQCLLGLGMQGVDSNSPTAAVPGSAYPAPSAEQLVNKFPNLEILHLIGQGGMGAVYQARQKNLDRLVALKILSPRLGNDPTFAVRFRREARTLAKLSHPNIVTVFNFGQVDEMYYLVMEYVEGVNLRDTIQAKTLDSEKALAVVPRICDALQYAHDKGVVHRDIKPENILVGLDGVVKIADFGLAKLLEPSADDFTLTNTRQVMGTLKYMAPEQIEKPEQVDHRADLYSLGVVFYELLTGELPIGRFSLPSEKAAINGRLDDVVMKTLEKEPDRRYQQASQIKTAVSDARQAYTSMASNNNASEHHSAIAEEQRGLVVPFRGDTAWEFVYGFAAINNANDLELEIEVCNGVTGIRKDDVQKFVIPKHKLVRADFQRGYFSHTIELQADSIDAFQDLPFAKHGSAKLKIKKNDGDRAFQLATHLQSLIAVKDAPVHNPPTVPVKATSVDGVPAPAVLTQTIRAALLFFFLAICVLVMLAITWYTAGKPNTGPRLTAVATVKNEAETLDPTASVTSESAHENPVAQVKDASEIATVATAPPPEFRVDTLSFGVIFLIGLIVVPTFGLVIGIILWLLFRSNKNVAAK